MSSTAHRDGRLRLLRAGSAAHAPLLLVHPSAGASSVYQPLARHLRWPGDVIGIDAETPPVDRELDVALAGMARSHLDALEASGLVSPYALAGWVVGGVLAAEMSVQAVERGHAVRFLALLDSPAPRAAFRARPFDDDTLGRSFAQHTAAFAGRQLTAPPADGTPASVTAALRAAELLPEGWTEEVVAARLAHFRAVVRAFLHHTQRRVATPIHAFEATARESWHPPRMPLEWELHCDDVRRVEAPGNHFTMIDETNAPALAALLDRCAADAMASGSASI